MSLVSGRMYSLALSDGLFVIPIDNVYGFAYSVYSIQ